MCYVCNPYCGKCKPPKEKPRLCPECSKLCFNVEHLKCEKCGAELPPRNIPEPVECQYTGMVCANPCGMSKKKKDDLMPCVYRTPPLE